MQIKKLNKYAKIMKISIVIAAIIPAGIAYSFSAASKRTAGMDKKTGCVVSAEADSNADVQVVSLEDKEQAGQDVIQQQSGQQVMESGSNIAVTAKADMYVYVCGCVQNPGVYGLNDKSRVYQAVDMAGGMTTGADKDYLNMAEFLKDGQKIYVPSESENLSGAVGSGADSGISEPKDQKVNINTAGKEQLMTLTGIGESRAQDIISYRNTNGVFKALEDIMNVPGIKEAAFAKIKEQITIK